MPYTRPWLIALTASLLGFAARADDWPQFRGPNRDGISHETGLLREWPASGPRIAWSLPMAQGYSAAAIHGGKVYFNDYDIESSTWIVRAVALDDGEALWRFEEPRRIRPNHGITRSVPAVDSEYVFSLDPKATFHALSAATGKEIWRKNLVEEYSTKIPPWYNGQCPLIEKDRVIIGTGGRALLVAFDKATGAELWSTPNPDGYLMSHASVMPATLGGVDQYLYSLLEGTFGIAASDGSLLWHHRFKFNVSVSPSPLAIDAGRVFITAGYDAGSRMFRVERRGEKFTTAEVFTFSPEQWSSEVQTPVVVDGHILGVDPKKRGMLTLLDLDGKEKWSSAGKAAFGLGNFIVADGMIFILEGATGVLRLLEATTESYRELASTSILGGHDVWGPLALSNGFLIMRDLERMVCIAVGKKA